MRNKDLLSGLLPQHISFLITLLLLSTILFSSDFASAQTEEEMKLLRMYFKEDALVLSPTRSLKPISKVAENISVVTAEEIQAMNAHTLPEVLERVTGLYIAYSVNDFFKTGSLNIQGSDTNVDEKRVLVLLDGMPWNFLSNGTPVTNTIPVGIIKRLEIIKGPASSAWGSSLGGVINIVTKDTSEITAPSGTVSASYGERHSQNYNAEVSGKAGIAGYYLYAGRQDSDGFRYNRYYEKDSLYGKIDVPLHKDARFIVTSGYSDDRLNYYDDIDGNSHEPSINRAFFMTGTLSASLTDNLNIEASLYALRQKFVLDIETLSEGDLLYESNLSEKKQGGSIKFIYVNHMHNAVLGWDVSHGSLDQTDDYTGYGLGTFESKPGISKWALFINDTLSIGKFSVTPGLRYDENNISGDFTSPSLGATYILGQNTILRASMSRGFNLPPLSYTSGASLGYEPNPSLKPERVWSYQGGAESLMFDTLRARIVFFQHNVKDEMQLETNAETGNDHHVNKGETRRTGMELDVETVPFYNVSVKAGFSYMRRKFLTDIPDRDTAKKIHDYNITVKYDDVKSLSAQLSGNYTWWDYTEYPDDNPRYDNFIWDLNLNKKIYTTDRFSTEMFLTAHNLFNGAYYFWDMKKNLRRWIEAGARLKF